MAFNRDQNIEITVDKVDLKGILHMPLDASGMVIFVHGSGSSRLSPRNNFVAQKLQERRIATLLFDLLTEEEDEEYANRFNIDLLTDRLVKVAQWVAYHPQLKHLPLGFFGASTGTAAALRAAIILGPLIKTIVSRGGRPDLVGAEIDQIKIPILLIIGGNDTEVLNLNRLAYGNIGAVKVLEVIPGAGHLFEEPGALEEVARLAADWFEEYLSPIVATPSTNIEIPVF